MANFDLNKSFIAGRLSADPELKQTQGGTSVCSFSVAVNRSYKEQDGTRKADFINCVAWREKAEFICKYFKKGSSIFVVGEIQTRSWEDNGQKRYATEIKIDEARFVDGKNDGAGAETTAQPTNPGTYTPAAYTQPQFATQSPQFEEIPGDESLPF